MLRGCTVGNEVRFGLYRTDRKVIRNEEVQKAAKASSRSGRRAEHEGADRS